VGFSPFRGLRRRRQEQEEKIISASDALAAAHALAEAEEAAAARARRVAEYLGRVKADNHVAARIAELLMGGGGSE
jgi:hypothetical protein